MHLYIANNQQLDYWLSKFVLETRRSDGEHYPPNTLYSICCGLLRYLREHRPEVNFFQDTSFAGFRKTLDGEMKRLHSHGLGVAMKQAEPLTVDEENQLWEQGLLGDRTPQTLLDTMLFLCGMSFALRSGQEHRSLQVTQFQLVEPVDGTRPYLVYSENCSKNNTGGLSDRKVKPKRVMHHANKANPERCLVQLYKKYLEHRPDTAETAFYLAPLKKPKGNVWYSKAPVGHNTLGKTVARVCLAGGIKGYKTNHSLRVTTATRLFQSGVDEQLIMGRTGHRSVSGVRTYKRISDSQKENLSNILNSATNGESAPQIPPRKKQKSNEDASVPSQTSAVSVSNTSMSSIAINNTLPSTPIPTSFTPSCIPPLHINGCSSVTVNYYVMPDGSKP